MQIINKNPTDLKINPNNSRTHSKQQLQQISASMDEFGFTNPILIDEDDVIIAGHGRREASILRGMSEVPCVVLRNLTETQRRAYMIADNQLPLNAGWDLDMLKFELEKLAEEDFDLDILGFDTSFLDDLFQDLATHEDKDTVPELEEVSITAPGDVWILGDHRLMCGDSTNMDSVAQLMDGEKAHLLLTDPPYNVDYTGKTAEALTIQNDHMDDEQFRQFLRDVMVAADANMAEGAVFYIWHADLEGYNFRGACKDAGWTVRQCLIWNKDVMVMGRQDYHWKHEPCLTGWKDGAAHIWNSDRTQTTVLEFKRPTSSQIHPTMKPVDLFEYQIQNSSNRGNIVLDLFGGSGTTIIACEQVGRRGRTMELDPRYCDAIVRRWQEYTKKDAIHEESGLTFNARSQ